MSQNYFSTGFGGDSPMTTNAPGSSGSVKNLLDPTGDPTTDTVTPTAHTFDEDSYGSVAGIGGHGAVEAAQTGHPSFGASDPDSTGASGGTAISHNHGE